MKYAMHPLPTNSLQRSNTMLTAYVVLFCIMQLTAGFAFRCKFPILMPLFLFEIQTTTHYSTCSDAPLCDWSVSREVIGPRAGDVMLSMSPRGGYVLRFFTPLIHVTLLQSPGADDSIPLFSLRNNNHIIILVRSLF